MHAHLLIGLPVKPLAVWHLPKLRDVLGAPLLLWPFGIFRLGVFCPIMISLRDSASATVVVAAHFWPFFDWVSVGPFLISLRDSVDAGTA